MALEAGKFDLPPLPPSLVAHSIIEVNHMDTNIPNPPFLANIGFMLTYKCTIACPHCVVDAGPHRKEEMSLEHSFDWIEQARNYRDGHIKGSL